MSSSILTIDPRLVVGDSVFKVMDSGVIVQPAELPADQPGPYSSSLIFTNILPPNSKRTAVSNPRIRYTVTVVAPAGDIVLPTKLGRDSAGAVENVNAVLRAFPLHSVATNLNLQLNSQVLTSQPRYMLSHAQRYIQKELIDLATCPAMADDVTYLQKQSNSVSVAVAAGGAAQTIVAPAQQVSHGPMCQYVDAEGKSRAAFLWTKVTAGGNDTYTITIEEPLLASPFPGLALEGKYLYNVNNMSINYSFSSFADMIYNQSGNAITSVAVSDARLEVTYITVGKDIDIPTAIHYPYNQYTVFTQSLGDLDTAATQTVNSQALKFSSLPKRIWMCVRPRIDARTSAATTTQANAADAALTLLGAGGQQDIGCLQVQIQNKTLFANATPKELYLESKLNGYRSGMVDFLQGSGSYICISPRNMGFDPSTDLVVGESGQLSFQAQLRVSFYNYALQFAGNLPANVSCELVTVIEQAGTIVLAEDATSMMSLGPISEAEVKAMFAKGGVPADHPMLESGAGLFGDAKHLLMRGLHAGVKHGLKALASERGQSVLKSLAGL